MSTTYTYMDLGCIHNWEAEWVTDCPKLWQRLSDSAWKVWWQANWWLRKEIRARKGSRLNYNQVFKTRTRWHTKRKKGEGISFSQTTLFSFYLRASPSLTWQFLWRTFPNFCLPSHLVQQQYGSAQQYTSAEYRRKDNPPGHFSLSCSSICRFYCR